MNSRDVLPLARVAFACYALAQRPDLKLALYHNIIFETLEAIERGAENRVMFFLPPRHGKSLFTTQLFPAWYLGRHPDRSIITVSYGQELADDFGRKVRNLVTSPIHRAIFPGFQLSVDATSGLSQSNHY